MHSFHVTCKSDLQEETLFFYPQSLACKASYLHLCKVNPGHWSPQALQGWPLSIRPSPDNFKAKRQHRHV